MKKTYVLLGLLQETLMTCSSCTMSSYVKLRSKQGWKPHTLEEYAEDVRRYLKSDAIFIARVGGEAVGFVRVSKRGGSYRIE